MNRTRLLLALLPLTVAAGCATVLQGTRQDVPVETEPPGATASAGDQTITTPGVLKLDRRARTVDVLVDKKGYVSCRVTLTRSDPNPDWPDVRVGVMGGEGPGSFVGVDVLPAAALGVDYATGAAYRLDPPRIVLRLRPVSEAGTEDR